MPLVVKNGSKARSTTSLAMPIPVSATRNNTYEPGLSAEWAAASSALSSTSSVVSSSVPPAGIASRALTARFITICSICAASASTAPRARSAVTRRMSSPSRRSSIALSSPSTGSRSSEVGGFARCRPKASSCRTSPTPRSAACPISSTYSRAGARASSCPSARWQQPMIPIRMLLKSCAMPLASRPTASMRREWWTSRSSCLATVRSRLTATSPTRSSVGESMNESDENTLTRLPSRRRWTTSPSQRPSASRRSRQLRASPPAQRVSSRLSRRRPSASPLLHPYIASAAWFQLRITWCRSVETMASCTLLSSAVS